MTNTDLSIILPWTKMLSYLFVGSYKIKVGQVWHITIWQHMILTCKTSITIHNLLIQYWDQKILYALLHWQNYLPREFDIKWHIISDIEKELHDPLHKICITYKGIPMDISFCCNAIFDNEFLPEVCTWHNSCVCHNSTAFVSYIELLSDQLIRIWIKTKWGFYEI